MPFQPARPPPLRPPPRPGEARSVDSFLAELESTPELRERLACVRRDEGRAAESAPLPDGLPPALVAALRAEGKDHLYRHQREAIDLALGGKHVVIATETSSGKSLCFQLPVLAATLRDPQAHALFLFPTNPLANDQESSLVKLIARLPEGARPRPPVRLQGSMGAEKDRIAASDPQIVLTNPEMVHLHLLPQHRRWSRFWAGLRYIVVDEIHLYRGAFGSHLANLLRRVRRCAWRYGAKPQVIAASATVGNPRELAQELCAAPFELVSRSTAPRGPRSTVLWRPPTGDDGKMKSYVDESVDLFKRALEAKLQCILFARSRQMVELMVQRLEERTGKSRIQLGVRAYRGGYLRDERETIEQGLRNGSVRGVVTTNALEVGIDIGSLDVCIIAGYPGSVMAMRQQAGRVGRRDRASAIVLVASANPLDTYLLQHPEQLLDAESERAVIGRLNPHVLRAHIACAASEFPLWLLEIERLGGEAGQRAAKDLVARGEARWGTEDGRTVLIAHGRAHGGVSLRSASQERWQLVDPDGETVGELDGASVAREAHPGAIYLHQGRAFRVERLEDGKVFLQRAPSGVSTRVQGERQVTVREVLQRRALPNGLGEVMLAQLDVVDEYSSYLESQPPRSPRARTIEPPIGSELKTEGLVVRLSETARAQLAAYPDVPVEAALHAVEHLVAALGSSLVLCDRDDLEGHTQLTEDHANVVLFDKHPGGMGLAAAAFAQVEAIVQRAGEAVDGCACESGCPACVHSGRCLRGNDDVTKFGARLVLRLLRGLPLPGAGPVAVPPKVRKAAPRVPAREIERPERAPKSNSDKPWSPEFSLGDRVEHAVYGEGRVVELRPSGRVVVDFGDGKPRRITPGWLRKA